MRRLGNFQYFVTTLVVFSVATIMKFYQEIINIYGENALSTTKRLISLLKNIYQLKNLKLFYWDVKMNVLFPISLEIVVNINTIFHKHTNVILNAYVGLLANVISRWANWPIHSIIFLSVLAGLIPQVQLNEFLKSQKNKNEKLLLLTKN